MVKDLKLQPFELFERAVRQARSAFAAHYGGDKLLVVRTEGMPDHLRRTLAACPTDHGPTWQGRPEPTATQTIIRRVLPGELEPVVVEHDHAHDLVGFMEQAHYVLPLRKRPDATKGDPERITVGRSRTCDIVLDHLTVSKLHAWLEHDESERLYVCDAGSTNFTRVGGRTLVADDLVSFGVCEEIGFGDVCVTVCTPELLWDALHRM